MKLLNKRIRKYAGLAIAIALLAVGIGAYYSMGQAGNPVTPFTALYNETSTDPTTERTMQRQSVYWAVRGDGSLSHGWLDERYGQRVIMDVISMRQITLSDPLKLKTTHDYSYVWIAPKSRNRPPDCRPEGTVSSLGYETIEGYAAYGYQRVTPMGDGKLEANEWFAPDLNCWGVRSIGRRYDSAGNLTGLFEKKTTSITAGEPDGALFAVPANYSETKPSDREKAALLQMVKDREGVSGAASHQIPSNVQSVWKSQDERYDAVMKKDWSSGR